MSDDLEFDLEGTPHKDDINLNLKKEKDSDGDFPEHIPLVPYNTQKEQEKEEARKLAKELRKKAGNTEAIINVKIKEYLSTI